VNPLFEPVKSEAVHADDVVRDVDTVSPVVGVSVRDGVSVNPLFDPESMEDEITGDAAPRVKDETMINMKLGQESGYSSLLDSLADPQAHLLRLLPPSKPQMVERSFESLASLHHSESMKNNRRKPEVTLEKGGSLKARRKRKMQNGARLVLW
jgi:hypothetical protein